MKREFLTLIQRLNFDPKVLALIATYWSGFQRSVFLGQIGRSKPTPKRVAGGNKISGNGWYKSLHSKENRSPLGMFQGIVTTIYERFRPLQSPGTAQELSDSSARQPSPLCSDRYAAMGLTLFLPQGDGNLSNLVGVALIAVVLATLFAAVQRYRKKQKMLPLLSICGQIQQMAIEIFSKAETDTIKAEIKNQINTAKLQQLKEKLEKSVEPDNGFVILLATSRLIDEINSVIKELNSSEDLVLIQSLFEDIARKVGVFYQEYCPELSEDECNRVLQLYKDTVGWSRFLLAIQQMRNAPTQKEGKKNLEEWFLGFNTLADLVDECWEKFPPVVEMKIAVLSNTALQATREPILNNKDAETKRRYLRKCAGFILGKINPVYSSLKNLGLNPKQQIRKNRGAIAWAKGRLMELEEVIQNSNKP